jgi:hypothetical protein
MRLQALRKVGVELQSNSNDADVTRDGCEGYDAQTKIESKSGAYEQEEEQDVCLVNKEEELVDEQKDIGSVDNTTADDSTSHMDKIDDKVKDTGLRTVRSLVNGGLAILALGALSPVGLILKHLDGLKEEESGGEERTEDGNDL